MASIGVIARIAIVVWTLLWLGLIVIGLANLDRIGFSQLARDVLIISGIYAIGLSLLARRWLARVLARRWAAVAMVGLAAAVAVVIALLPLSVGFMGTTLDCGGSAFSAIERGPPTRVVENLAIPRDVFLENFRDWSPGAIRLELVGGAKHVCQRAAIRQFVIAGAIILVALGAVVLYSIVTRRRGRAIQAG